MQDKNIYSNAIQSMTGYGESTYEDKEIYLHVTLKTLNSKYLDLDLYLPRAFASQEMTYRKHLAQHFKRGKVFLNLTCQLRNVGVDQVVNENLLNQYIQFFQKIAQPLSPHQDILNASFRLPGLIRSEMPDKLSDAIIAIADQKVMEALVQCLAIRLREGKNLVQQLEQYSTTLYHHLDKLDDHITAQQNHIRTKIQARLKQEPITTQEWEQELTVTLNKSAIEEEKIRFKSHLELFEKTLKQKTTVGKKLIFITQELSRELNTMGAKAQYNPLQHLVIDMKEIVEQIRQQIANLA